MFSFLETFVRQPDLLARLGILFAVVVSYSSIWAVSQLSTSILQGPTDADMPHGLLIDFHRPLATSYASFSTTYSYTRYGGTQAQRFGLLLAYLMLARCCLAGPTRGFFSFTNTMAM